MEIVSLSARRSIRGSILDYRISSEYFNDSYTVGCWPMRDSGMDVVGGKHADLTNVNFSEGAAYFNGINAFGVTPSIDLTSTDKVTLLADVKIHTYNLITSAFICEFSASSAAGLNPGSFATYMAGTIAGDPFTLNTTGNVGQDITRYSIASTNFVDKNKHFMASIHDFSLNGNEGNYYHDGVLLTPVLRTSVNNTGNFGDYPLYFGMRGGATFPANFSLSNVLLRKKIESAETIADYYAWQNDTRRANFWSLYFANEEETAPVYSGGWGIDHAYIRKRKEAEEAEKKAEQSRLAAEQAEANRIAEEEAAESRLKERTKNVLGKIEAQAIEAQLLALRAAEIEAREAYEQFLEIYEQARQDALTAFREYEAQKALEAAQEAIAAEQLRVKIMMENELRDVMTIMLMEL